MPLLRTLTHGRFALPWVTLTLAGICAALYALFGGMPELLVYDRAAILNGEWWRLVTGHFVHLDLQHFGTNVGALLALGFLFETSDFGGARRLALGVTAVSGLLISTALFFGSPATAFYCGLSAILNTLFVATALGMWRETGNKLWLAACVLDLAKIGWEAAFGPIFSGALAWPPHTGAHVAGFVAGCLFFGFSLLHRSIADVNRLARLVEIWTDQDFQSKKLKLETKPVPATAAFSPSGTR